MKKTIFVLKMFLSIIIEIGDKMFYNYKILTVNDEEILYLYVNSIFEFSLELENKINDKDTTVYNKVKNYIEIMDIDFTGKKVMLVVDGIIIGSLMLANNSLEENNRDSIFQYKEFVDLDKDDNIEIITDNRATFTSDEDYIVSKFIRTIDKKGRVSFVSIDNCLTNILSKIIPPTYEKEALKSAAILARTTLFKELSQNNYLDNYEENNYLKELWKSKYNSYINNLTSAVEETRNIYLENNGNFTNITEKYKVPFSNYGANLLAKRGYNYLDILGHYYPGFLVKSV